MKKKTVAIAKLVFLCSLFIGISGGIGDVQAQEASRKIVVFEKAFSDRGRQIALVKSQGAQVIKPLALINAVAVFLPEQAEKALLSKAEVVRIDEDIIVNAIAKPQPQPQPQPAQELPWGIDRINAEIAQSTTGGLAVKVAILDTGIDLDHPDLLNNIKGNVNTISSRRSGNADNGHGTHVAGIIAEGDNSIGVVGVEPEIYLYAVKVLGKNGSGWLSDIIEGFDWCINNKMQVVNMSFGSSGDNQSFHDAISKTYAAGVVLVAAAGNDGAANTVNYPAKYPEVIAVSAIGQDDKLAGFSSFGPEVDIAAPGVTIKSTYNDGYYKSLNGTSMACPHVVGVAALVLSTAVGAYDTDGDGAWGPSEVKNKLEATAENLGLSSNEQGAGLVRADLAVQ